MQWRLNQTLENACNNAYNSGLISWSSPEDFTLIGVEVPGLEIANSYVASGVLTADDQSIYKVAVCPGDSGGPLIKGNKLVGVSSRVDNDNTKSFFTSLQHKRVSDFLTQALSGKFRTNDNHKIIELNADKSFLKSDSFTSRIEQIRSQYEYIDQNKMAIKKELGELYASLKSTLTKKKVANDLLAEVWKSRNENAVEILSKISALHSKYSNENLLVLPSLLAHDKPTFFVGRTIDLLMDFSRLASSLEVSKEHPTGWRFTPLEFMNDFLYYGEFNGQMERGIVIPIVEPDVTVAPPNPFDQMGRINLYELAAGDSEPVKVIADPQAKILEDIHIIDENQVVQNLTRFIHSKGWKNRTLVVPHFTLQPNAKLPAILEIRKANAILIRGGKILEVMPLK